MKNLLLISFDIRKPGESGPSLAVGSILATLHAHPGYGEQFIACWQSIDLMSSDDEQAFREVDRWLTNHEIHSYSHLAIGCYIWSERHVQYLLSGLRKVQYSGIIICAGYQVSYSDNKDMEHQYPLADLFIQGYAEQSMVNIMTGNIRSGKIQNAPTNITQLPSPYLSGIIPVQFGQRAVRMETKRGCPYACTFCAHRDLVGKKVNWKCPDRMLAELNLFHQQQVQKINLLDPIFQMNDHDLNFLEAAIDIGFKGQISLQSRFELLHTARGQKALELYQHLNVHLEFGLQTMDVAESRLVKRGNRLQKVRSMIEKLNQMNIPYEVSMIYGLPTQTLQSFKEGLDKLRSLGVPKIIAWPLMLYPGTELFDRKEEFGIEEQPMGEFKIPTVVKSDSFSYTEWLKMEEIAQELLTPERI